MPTFVALLRGVNVSGKRPVPMAKLAASLEARGLTEVATYKASGNVIFESTAGDTTRHAVAIRKAVAEDFGHDDVEVLVLRATDARKIASANPLLSRAGVDTAFLHATFPFGKVEKRAFDRLAIPASSREIALLSGGVVYLYCPDGYGRTKINNTWWEKALGVPCTTRNWNTVLAIADLLGH